MKARKNQYDIFISYRRNGGEYTAKVLRDRLNELGYRVFFDVESLRSGDFNTRLFSVIEGCTDFLVILSPDALERCSNPDDWVRQEIECALAKGKNVVPVLMRGFSFPKELPPSIEPLRFKNGLESNTQFFDAFMDKLCTRFLQSKPQNKRVSPWKMLTIALLVCALAAGAVFGVRRYNSVYPRTAAEYALTDELLYCVEGNLSAFSLSAKGFNRAIQAGLRYLNTGEKDRELLESDFALAKDAISSAEQAIVQPSDQLMARLASAPVSGADLTAMYDQALVFRDEMTQRTEYLHSILLADENVVIPSSAKQNMLECYERYLDETIKAYTLCANSLLLPLRDEALESFWYEYLQTVDNLPLSASQWLKNKKEIDADIDACAWNISATINELSRLIGSVGYQSEEDLLAAVRAVQERNADEAAMNFEQQKDKTLGLLLRAEAIELQVRIENGRKTGRDMSELETRRAEYLAMEKSSIRSLGNVKALYGAAKGDSAETLFEKMGRLLGLHCDASALECLEAYEAAIRGSDPNMEAVIPTIRLFINSIRTTGCRYGIIVADTNPLGDGPNEVFRQGDIIVAFNGRDCRTLPSYLDQKNALDGNEFSVTVLRENTVGSLETVDLHLTKDMPLVYLTTITIPFLVIDDAEAAQVS